MREETPHLRRTAVIGCLLAAVTSLACAALMSAAAMLPAPPAVIPIVVLCCIGCPMLAAVDLAKALRTLRETHWAVDMRRHLEQLPETPHPLGL